MPALERMGGVSGWRQAEGRAAAAGMEMSSHVLPEISSPVLAATPTAHWLEYVDWANPILREPIRIVDGTAIIPDRPRSGLEWNDDPVARYRIDGPIGQGDSPPASRCLIARSRNGGNLPVLPAF